MKIMIEIDIKPHYNYTVNSIESSFANKVSCDVVNKITKKLEKVDTSKLYFNFKITTKDC